MEDRINMPGKGIVDNSVD